MAQRAHDRAHRAGDLYIAIDDAGTVAIADLVAPVLTVGVVSAATALVGLEFEREAVRSSYVRRRSTSNGSTSNASTK